jgi:diguanylate cyclase (GGDEF)-like protein
MDMAAKLSLLESTDQQMVDISRVMVELDHFKKQSERLDIMNRLHARMAGVLNLSGMIEAYSIWLMPLVNHELIGYNNSSRNKKHLFCSGHGPNRRKAIAFAEELIKIPEATHGVYSYDNDHYAHKWVIEREDDAGILLILKSGKVLNESQIEIINDSLTILSDSLQRALDYEDLFQRATVDDLTGLANRRVFEERIPAMIDSASRYNKPLTMLSMDLDKFKHINDKLGHLTGDQVLKSVARELKNAIRSSDLLVRMGGDEFILVLDNTCKDSARILAERLCLAIDKLEIWADSETKLGISIGLAQLESDETLRAWLERADDILYHAKSAGRSRVAVD